MEEIFDVKLGKISILLNGFGDQTPTNILGKHKVEGFLPLLSEFYIRSDATGLDISPECEILAQIRQLDLHPREQDAPTD